MIGPGNGTGAIASNEEGRISSRETAMRKPFVVLLFAAILAGLAGPVRAEDPDELEYPVAAVDLALIDRVAKALPAKGGRKALETALAADYEEVRDQGFGATWRRYELYGDRVTLWIDVVAWKDRVAALRVRSIDGEPTWKAKAKAAWGEATVVSEDGVDLRIRHAGSLEAMDQARAKALGRASDARIGEAAKRHVSLLTDPLEELTFGTICYEDGSPPEGRVAADALRLLGSLRALDRVLRASNPEGRMYAAEAMLLLEAEGEALGAKRRAALDKVLALAVPIRSCAGCLVSDEKAATLAAPERLREQIACRVVERIQQPHGDRDVGEIRLYWNGTYACRTDHAGSGPSHGRSWIRDRLPESVFDPVVAAVRAGDGFQVERGTPFVVHHRDAETAKLPPAVAALIRYVRAPRPESAGGSGPR